MSQEGVQWGRPLRDGTLIDLTLEEAPLQEEVPLPKAAKVEIRALWARVRRLEDHVEELEALGDSVQFLADFAAVAQKRWKVLRHCR
jgi:hypothetical protein